MGTDFEVTMNEYLPLRDVVFNTLRQAILRGELKPGERLMGQYPDARQSLWSPVLHTPSSLKH